MEGPCLPSQRQRRITRSVSFRFCVKPAGEPMPVLLATDDLQCSICLELLSNPATVQCGHSFCLHCIRKWVAEGQPECPNCKRRVPDKLPERTVLLNLILERYNCLASGDPLPTENSRLAEPGFPDRARGKRDVSLPRRGFQDYMFQTRSSISKAFSFMKKCICDQEKIVLRIIEEEWNVAEQITDKQINGKNPILDLQNTSEEVMMKMSSGQEDYIGDPIQKISNIASAVEELRRQLEAAILRNFPAQPSQKPSPGTSNNSEAAADGAKEMFLSIDSFPRNDSVQEASSSSSAAPSPSDRELPMISSSFSQWMSIVTFDDETVGCSLEITGNKRKVRVSRSRKQYERSPKRFCNGQVLGSPGFSEGRHYWEVNSKGSSVWAIGVASGDIGTKDRLGRNELSWCLEFNKHTSAWHNSQQTKIDENRPLRVGVFLDFPTKTLSFYSLTDKETCLHKFEINAANPVYPAFWIASLNIGESLTINDVNRH
ncbi:PREDICTED: E3 ubiquitin-protein ligase RNF135 [Thamnophis sirtalis]|uniref:E3 ubiquitin-protein ligase RNF135 n=1 Tax=Thamnophis sirtalis TaxID=35019 RepID=A0A6I9YCJ8_9SAUR|nr:PREDICTED: E3 ubiquitin-protein ligase RNF135 [Thamnophis sirtalis]